MWLCNNIQITENGSYLLSINTETEGMFTRNRSKNVLPLVILTV